MRAEVVDESCAGVGLVFDGASMEAGSKVNVAYFGIPARGVVRYCEPLEGGRKRIGVEWTEL